MTKNFPAFRRAGRYRSARRLHAMVVMAGATAFALATNAANAAGGYTYKLVRLFNGGTSPETLQEYVLNDKGQVAYLTSAASTGPGGGTNYYIHLWDPTAAVIDTVVYSAQALSCSTSTIGLCSGTSNPVPILRGAVGYSGSLALSNTGVVSLAAYVPQPGNALTYSNTGYVNIDLTQQPTLFYTVSTNNVSSGGMFTQGTQLSANGARAIANYGPGNAGPMLGVSSPSGLLLSSNALSLSWNTSTPGAGSTRPVPAINSAGLASVVTSPLAGPPPSILDLPAGSSTPAITTFGDSTWVSTGHLALNSRGEAAIMTVGPLRAALMPSVRTPTPRVLADASVFPTSVPVFAISLSDRDELTFQSIESGTWPGIWSLAADGTPVEVFSSLDPNFIVQYPNGMTQDLSPCNGPTFCAGNGTFWYQEGSYEPYDNIVANNHGAVAFYMVLGNGGPLVVAVPAPGLRPSAPVLPTAQDPVTNLMTFSAPCGSLYSGSGFMTTSLTPPGGAFAGSCYVDPALATGYTLTSASGADNFQSVIVPAPLPGGQSSFTLNYLLNGSPISAQLTAEQVYAFPAGGVASFSITGINATENLSSADPNAFVLGLTWVNKGTQPTDFTMQPQADTGPTITNSINGTLGNNGWYTGDVTVSWNVTDAAGAITSESGCSTTTISADTPGLLLTCSATSAGGAATQSVTIKRDATPPMATATSTPLPNTNGWNNTGVNVAYTGTDSTSGIASCSAPAPMNTQGINQTSPAGTCTDNAGNVSAPVSATNINIDGTPPVVSASATPPANVNGWRNSPVTVTFTAVDSLSGVAANACGSPVILATNGAGQTVVGSCSDKAGNFATGSVTGINIDTIAPTVLATATPAANTAGWNNSTVTVAFTATDDLSGSGVAACSSSVVLTTAGSGIVAAGTCTDKAGNISQGSRSVNLDETPPILTVATPAMGASYAVGSVANAAYSCADGLSGVASCIGSVASGAPIDTSSAGTKTFAVTGVDYAGNSATSSITYTVAPASVTFSLSPTALNFGNQAVNSSTTLSITLTSTGTAALPINRIAVTSGNAGQFSQSNTCGTTLPAGASCLITVSFDPTSVGTKTSSLTVNAAGRLGTQTVTLTGSGVAPTFSVSPATLAFGNQAKDISSAPLTVTVTNTGSIPLPINSINLGGANAAQFAIAPVDQSGQVVCGSNLPAGGSCEIDVVFMPTSTGAKTATIKVAPGGGGTAQTIVLSGNGIVPTYTLIPATLNFGNQAHATNSAPLSIILANTGSLVLPVTSIAATGQFSEINTCGNSVTAGTACTIYVTFSPTSRGAKTGTIRVTAGGGAAATTATVSGTGT